jgi:uncharacterized membrane protein
MRYYALRDRKLLVKELRTNLIAGLLTVIPLVVVWIVLSFILAFLSAVGSPVARGVTLFIIDRLPGAAPILENEFFQWLVAIIVALLLLYTIGAIASRVVGKRLIASVEGLISRIPIVETVYSASKKLIGMLQQKPDGSARVVLLDFPQPGMKAIGLVMRVFPDSMTGEELAAVYVPTTPNPTSGYLEILPVRLLIPTTMTMDQAMTMIVSGGAIAPEHFSIAPHTARHIGPAEGAAP